MNRLETILQIIWKRSRFTSYFYQTVQIIENHDLPTLALHVADKRIHLLFNPVFINKTDTEELIGLLVHEMMHVILNHDHRGLPRYDPILQNLAQDMVVNTCLADWRQTFFSRFNQGTRDYPELVLPAGLPQVPRGYLADNPVMGPEDITWENLYRWMVKKQDARQGRQVAEDEFQTVQLQRFGQNEVPLEESAASSLNGFSLNRTDGAFLPTGIHLIRQEEDQHAVQVIKHRVFHYSDHDNLCRDERFFHYLSGIIEKIQLPDRPFDRKMLKAFVENASLSDDWKYAAGRFDRRYFASGIYVPGRVYGKKMTVTIAVDVSGSMVVNPTNLEKAFGVVESLLGQYKVFLLCVDEEVFTPRKHDGKLRKSDTADTPYAYRKGDWRLIQSGSSGTTFFAPLFGQFMQGHREPLIVITDGDVYDLDRLQKYQNTLWVITGKREKPFTPPFGKAATMYDTDG